MTMRKLTLTLLTLILAFSLSARERIDGFVEYGNQKPKVAGQLALTTPVQGSYPGATVTVYLAGTSTLATVYDTAGGATKGNPFTADVKGYYYFYANDGCYDIRYSGGGIPASYTRADICTREGEALELFNVKAYGAKGDGVTNDTDGVQTAVSALIAAGGGHLYFPPGTYLWGDQSAGVTKGENLVHISGLSKPIVISGSNAKLLLDPSIQIGDVGGSTAVTGWAIGLMNNRGPITIEGLEIDGNLDNLTYSGSGSVEQGHGVMIFDCAGPVTVKDVYTHHNPGDGVYVGDSRFLRDVYRTWEASSYYPAGSVVVPTTDNGFHYRALTSGTTGGTEPATWPTTSSSPTVVDGGVTWSVVDPNGRGHLLYNDESTHVTLLSVRSEYNSRQGLSHVGGLGLTAIGCSFSYTGQASVSNNPRSGVDIEPVYSISRDLTFINCQFIDNELTGFVTNQSRTPDGYFFVSNVNFYGCTFYGSDSYWVLIPDAPNITFRDCIVFGAVNGEFSDGLVAWAASTAYNSAGVHRRPTTYNGHRYRVLQTGTSGATEPTWPTTTGGTVTDGTVVWKEDGPLSVVGRRNRFVNCTFSDEGNWYPSAIAFIDKIASSDPGWGIELQDCKFVVREQNISTVRLAGTPTQAAGGLAKIEGCEFYHYGPKTGDVASIQYTDIGHTKFFDGATTPSGTFVSVAGNAVRDGVKMEGSKVTWNGSVGVVPQTSISTDSLTLAGASLQSFVITFDNQAGTIKHRFQSAFTPISLGNWVSEINGVSTSYSTTPTGSLTAGAGFDGTDGSYLILDTDVNTTASLFGIATIFYNDTGTQYAVDLMTRSTIGHERLALKLFNPTTGASVNWATALGASGNTMEVKVVALIK